MLFEAIEFGMVYWFLHLAALQEGARFLTSGSELGLKLGIFAM